MRRENGSIGDFLAVGICMIFLSLLMVRYMDSVGLINEKEQVNQLVRQYILRMETVGRLTSEDRAGLLSSLQELGVSESIRGEALTLEQFAKLSNLMGKYLG